MTNPAYVNDEEESSGDEDAVDAGPTATEATLPWNRDPERANVVCEAPLKQREFPAWLKNEDYMVHGEPSEAIVGAGEY